MYQYYLEGLKLDCLSKCELQARGVSALLDFASLHSYGCDF